eukprot:scaffold1558_cov403-Prasinococcus_capsulatus_cf.AAC.24
MRRGRYALRCLASVTSCRSFNERRALQERACLSIAQSCAPVFGRLPVRRGVTVSLPGAGLGRRELGAGCQKAKPTPAGSAMDSNSEECVDPRFRVIEYRHSHLAGIDDRLSIQFHLAALAFLLRATVVFPHPCHMLSLQHNDGVALPCTESFHWDRYHTFRVQEEQARVFNPCGGIVREDETLLPLSGNTWSKSNQSVCSYSTDTLSTVYANECVFGFAPSIAEFDDAIDHPSRPLKWVFDFNYYRQRNTIERVLERHTSHASQDTRESTRAPSYSMNTSKSLDEAGSHIYPVNVMAPVFHYSAKANETAEAVISEIGNKQFYVLKWRRSDKLALYKKHV